MAEILVVGAGAIGGWLAAKLAQAGEDVALLARGARLAEICRDGIELAENGKVARLRLAAFEVPVAPARLICLCTKAGDVGPVLETLAPAVAPGTVFLTMQNGIEVPGLVSARYPEAVVLAARVHGFFELVDGQVRHVGVEPSLLLGNVGGGSTNEAIGLCELLAKAGIAASHSNAVEAALWEKFVLAAAFGGVSAATGLAAGAIRRNAATWTLLREAIDEVCMLAEVRGITLPVEFPAQMLGFVAAFPDEARSSLVRDLEAHRASEYGSLTGAVLHMAEQSGLELASFRKIEAMIQARGLLPQDPSSV